MTIKYSIIIPTYTNFNGFKECLESVIKYTDFEETEIIAVLNGAPTDTVAYCNDIVESEIIPLYNRFKIVFFDEPIGFPKAINKGIEKANICSKFYILLNDDCVLLPQNKNSWIDMLEDPFRSKSSVGVTGPLKNTCPVSNRDFILFFCSMIPSKIWEKYGPLNEEFYPGGGEDILFCIKAEEDGCSNIQVPNQFNLDFNRDKSVFYSQFPIYHPGGATVKNIKGFSEHLKSVSEKIASQYGKKNDFGGHSYSDFREESIDIFFKAYPDPNLRVLDIGAGAGIYSCLKEKYKVVDAIEVWEPNIFKNNLMSKYDYIYYMDIMDFDFEKNKYDLVVLGDVLEHLSVEDSMTLIDRMANAGVKNGLIHIPFEFEQGPLYGNKYETHKQPDLTPNIVKERYPSFSPIQILNWKGVYFLNNVEGMEKKLTVTATISTKDRYFDTLPVAIASIISQTVKPDEFILFEDGEKLDIRGISIYSNMLSVLDFYKIKWKVIFGEGKGQVLNHQKAIDMVETDLIWRLDDDVHPEPNVLESLLENFKDEEVGAVGPLVLFPNNVQKCKKPPTNGDIYETKNGSPSNQWFIYPEDLGPFPVQHLNCTFLFRVNAAKHGYCRELSPAGHREETLFTYEMFKEGWKVLIDPRAKTWHYRNPNGGIRSYTDTSMWENDEKVFEKRIKEIGYRSFFDNKKKKKKIILLSNGRGDHVEFLMILPELIEKYNHITISCCYPDIFHEYFDHPKVEVCSTKDTESYIGNAERYNVYEFMSKEGWTGHIRDAYRKMYL